MTPPQNSSSSDEFVVRQSPLINGILTGFFSLVFLGLVIMYSADDDNPVWMYIELLVTGAVVLLISLKNALSKKEVIRINAAGFYYKNILITTWSNFYYACILNVAEDDSASDYFKILIQYYDTNGILMERRLPAPDTLDKSVYEIIDAINNYKQCALHTA